ncbi:GPP34 family phosphoprotein [Streptomyces sp. NPDC002623]
MTTARDLMIVALDVTPDVTPVREVGQGDLALALAGAEAIDLLRAEALTVEDDLLVPGPPAEQEPDDPLLAEAASSLVREEPYESVEDWLWRRGSGLSSTYTDRLEADGLIGRPRGRLLGVRSMRTAPVDSPARRRATARWASDEPVLAALATAVGLREEPADGGPDRLDDAVVTILAAVGDAVAELDAVRRRRSIEDAAFGNVWRAF